MWTPTAGIRELESAAAAQTAGAALVARGQRDNTATGTKKIDQGAELARVQTSGMHGTRRLCRARPHIADDVKGR